MIHEQVERRLIKEDKRGWEEYLSYRACVQALGSIPNTKEVEGKGGRGQGGGRGGGGEEEEEEEEEEGEGEGKGGF
jgi:hypothetical protein